VAEGFELTDVAALVGVRVDVVVGPTHRVWSAFMAAARASSWSSSTSATTQPSAAGLTRYRIELVGSRNAKKNRVEKLLEDASIKLSAVASDIFGVSGRAMMAALIAGKGNPKALADMARSRMRSKTSLLEEASPDTSMTITGSC